MEFIADLLKTEHPEMSYDKLKEIVLNGIKGKYDGDYQQPINSRTVFMWIRKDKELRPTSGVNYEQLTRKNREKYGS